MVDKEQLPDSLAPDSGDPGPSAVSGDLSGPVHGEPNTLPPTFCRVCQVEVTPIGKGRCPGCQTFLRLNFYPRKHPVNKLRLDQHLAEVVEEFGPTTTSVRRTCEQLAGIYEQLEGLKPGSTEWQRLVTTAQTLVAVLDSAREARESSTPRDYGEMSIDQLIERAEKTLAIAKAIRDKTPYASAAKPLPSDPTPEVASSQVAPPPRHIEPVAPAPPLETCPYCHKPLADCAEMRVARPDVFEALHYNSPEMVEKRRQYNTAVMLKTMPHGSGITRW